jgi:DNA polymerase III epsilon subunit family exonuclease
VHDDAGAAGGGMNTESGFDDGVDGPPPGAGCGGDGSGLERHPVRRYALPVDAATIVPQALLVDASSRAQHGVRISLPPRAAGARPAYPLGYAEVARARWLARDLKKYGDGWADPDTGAPTDTLRSLEYVVVDVETTGGSAWSGHRITEVAAVRLDGNGRKLDEYATLVNPERSIPPFITRLTRISPAMVERAPRFADVAPEVRRILKDAVFVAHNASFDWRFLSTEMQWVREEPLRGRVVCTVRLARKVVPEVPRRSLDSLSDYFGIENVARHRAFGDARATAEMFALLLDRLDELRIAQWHELETLLSRRAPRRKRRATPEPASGF